MFGKAELSAYGGRIEIHSRAPTERGSLPDNREIQVQHSAANFPVTDHKNSLKFAAI